MKTNLFSLSAIISILTAMTSVQLAQAAENNMLIILDGSNSMWGQIDNVAKIETARGALDEVLDGLPEGAKVGLMAYGHTDKESCTDVEMLADIAAPDAATIKSKIKDLKPKGKTPIAYSMKQAGEQLKQFEGDNNYVVLISDGIETCEGDPCAIAAELAKNNVATKVHAVGFDVNDEARKQLECIAEKGNGQYFNADSAESLKLAMQEVKKATVEKAPEPELTVYFEDNFDGDTLADHWEVMNPNPDAYIIENGTLSILAGGKHDLLSKDDTLPNIFKLLKPLPSGDFTATMRVITDAQTLRERYMLGLLKDKDNMLYGMAGLGSKCCYHSLIGSWAHKVSGGTLTEFYHEHVGPKEGNDVEAKREWLNANVDAMLVRIEKKGREYKISTKVEGSLNEEEQAWQPLQELTSLRMPGDFLFLAARQDSTANSNYHVMGGETLVNIDWVKIEAAAE